EFKHAIVIEESHHVLSGERRSLLGGQSVMEITFREIREFGESLIILDQHPSQIALPALGNAYATICLNLKHAKDVNAMGQCMLIEGKEKDALGSLEVGEALVKLQGRVRGPFKIQIPKVELQKGRISDEFIAAAHRSVSDTARLAALPKRPVLLIEAKPPRPDASTFANWDTQLLADVKNFPESGIAQRYKRLGISVRQGQKLKSRLAEHGLIVESREKTASGAIRIIRLTAIGKTRLDTSAEPSTES
ncbi:hypothetical protein ACFL34_04890, partial [Candidatus Sumerlaeota bacterium]